MRELEHLLPDLAPPPGGLARLQRSVAASRRPASHIGLRWAVAGAACVAVAVIVAATLPPWIIRQQRSNAIVQAFNRSAASSATTIRVANGAAIELPSGQANVKLYLVQTIRPIDRDRQEPGTSRE